MGKIEINHTGSGSGITLSSDGTSLLLGGTAIGGGGADLYAANESSPSAQPSATGANAIAIGDSAVSSVADGIAIGLGATHTSVHGSGSNAIAIGANTVADGYSTAIGAGTGSSKTTASGNSCLAIGYTATSTGTLATAIGKSRASGTSSFAASIDNNTTSYGATTQYSIAIGYRAKAGSSDRSVAIGSSTEADYRSVAIGYNAGGTGSYGISLGANSGVSIYASSAAIGYNVQSTASNQVSIGGTTQDVRISETYTLPKVDGTNGQVLTTNGSGVVAFADAGGGGGSPDLFNENYTTGTKPSATGANAIATGKQATATGADAFGHGVNADAAGQYSVSFGVNSEATGISAIAMGRDSVATGSQSFAGTNSRANGQHCTAFSIGNNSTSYGAGGQYSVAIGKQSKTTTTTTDNVAIGINAISNVTGGVSIAGAGYPVLISNVYSLPTADGSANEVLTTNGSGAVSWAAAGGGGGGPMAFISTTTLTSAAADVEFSGLGTDYEYYKLFYRYTQPTGTDTQYLMWRGMISGSQVSGIYSHNNMASHSSGMNYGPSYTSCLLSSVFGEKEVSGEVTIYGIGKSNSRIMVHGNGVQQRTSAPYSVFGLHSGYGQAQTGTWNGFAIKGLFYNLPIGATFSLYGIKNA